MSGIDLYNLNNPQDFYRIIQEELAEYTQNPTEKGFLFLILGFTHLREWIAEGDYRKIDSKQKNGQKLTEGEQFFIDIYALPSYQVIQELCNRSKHFISRQTKNETSKDVGLCVGHGRVGDSLNQTYFLIDGKDSRDHFYALTVKYNEWFADGA